MHRFLLLIFIAICGLTFAQEITVSGTCTDADGKGILGVRIRVNKGDKAIYTIEDGSYRFPATVGDSLHMEYFIAAENKASELHYFLASEKDSILPQVRFNYKTQIIDGVHVSIELDKPFDIAPLKVDDWQLLPVANLERFLVYTTPATSNNELTSNYNVRGGSYNENLVYVNGFQIYRPFLTRAGQQEGMSFINSALVESLNFSAGGFDARYGDKLSSVLDIHYRKPDTLRGSIMASMLGVEGHMEQQLGKKKNFSYLMGARYRSNGYFLNSLPTKGSYNPIFWDVQFLTDYVISPRWTWSLLGHYSSNNYRFIPQTQKTDFGTANEAYSFTIYFDGQEQTLFRTAMGGTKLAFTSYDKKTKLDFYATAFNSDEREYFDIQGQYYINQLETDPSKEEFGDSIAVLGVGTYLNHARNRLRATILNVYHDGSRELYKGFSGDDKTRFRQHDLIWGVNYQHDDFYDVLSEWKLVDSAGYSIPQSNDGQIQLLETIKGQLNLQAHRITGHTQLNSIWSRTKKDHIVTLTKKFRDSNKNSYQRTFTDTLATSTAKWALAVGTRAGYTSSNGEFYVTPRASVMYYPRAYMIRDSNIVRRNMSIRFATGLYYQPPFYREFRTFSGGLNLDVLAQKSYHAVLGYDMFFNMWGRKNPFKFSTEVYYKYMWDVNPFDVENVRTRYYANNDAVAYAYGIDFNMHGEFVPGIESFFKVGLLSTKEDLKYDSYTEYYNAAGDKIVFGISEDQTVVDSAVIEPGYIPRPTDQWVNVGILIQDQMPGIEALSVQMGLQYGSPLPYGPPGGDRYKDTLRMKSYFRVDIGTSYDFLYNRHKKDNFWSKHFTDAILSFEVYNLLGINNVLSKQWIQGTDGTYYSIPNYLTQRRFNLKLIVRF